MTLPVCYSVFAAVVTMEDWHLGGRAVRRRFNSALAIVADDPQFSPEAMGAYLRGAAVVVADHALARDRFIHRCVWKATMAKYWLMAWCY